MKTYTKNSSMRLALVWGMWLVTLIFLALAYSIIFNDTVNYSGIALVIGSLTAFIGALVTGKYWQKKVEVSDEKAK